MKHKLILINTILPFVIIWQLFTFQREQVNPEIEFKRQIHEISDKIVDKIDVPSGSSPTFLELRGDDFLVYSVENKNFIYFNKQKEMKIYEDKNFKSVVSFRIDSNKISALDQNARKLVDINTNTGVFVYTDLPGFSHGVSISDTVLLLASNDTLDTDTKDLVFFKYNIRSHKKDFLKVPLQIVGDYGLAHDGFFSYSIDRKQLIYVLYHLGKVVTFDEKFENIQSYNTLDNYRFNPIVVKKGNMYYLSRKTVWVNVNATLNERFTFIVSRIKSVDDKKNGVKGELIDIYDAFSPYSYKFSIHMDSRVKQILDIKTRENYIYLMTISDNFKNEILKIDLSHLL